jgi:predicted nucleic acid-binding Zn ribbon protein
MSGFEENSEIEKLKKENKRLRTSNIILTIYVILSLIVMIYNYWF